MKKLFASALLLCSVFCNGQIKNYKQYEVCISTQIHKGKLNHGKSYCTGWATVNEYKDGRKDTVASFFGGQLFMGDEYEKYNKLSERGKYIVDSLKEDRVTQFQYSYLTYEPIYMKTGKKTEQLWNIEGENIKIYEYLFWKNSKGNGIQLVKEFLVY